MLKKYLITVLILLSFFTQMSSVSFAGEFVVDPAPNVLNRGIGGPNPANTSEDFLGIPIRNLGGPTGLLTILIQTAIIIASIGFFVYLIVGGIRWLTSGGDKVALQGARDSIVHALIGLIIIIAAYATIRILEAAFGLSIISGIKFPSPIPTPPPRP